MSTSFELLKPQATLSIMSAGFTRKRPLPNPGIYLPPLPPLFFERLWRKYLYPTIPVGKKETANGDIASAPLLPVLVVRGSTGAVQVVVPVAFDQFFFADQVRAPVAEFLKERCPKLSVRVAVSPRWHHRRRDVGVTPRHAIRVAASGGASQRGVYQSRNRYVLRCKKVCWASAFLPVISLRGINSTISNEKELPNRWALQSCNFER